MYIRSIASVRVFHEYNKCHLRVTPEYITCCLYHFYCVAINFTYNEQGPVCQKFTSLGNLMDI